MNQRGWRHAVGMVTCVVMLVAMALGGGIHAAAQDRDSTPASGALVGQDRLAQQPAVTPTPVVGSASGQQQAPPAAESNESLPSGPVASGVEGDTSAPVLAQGLIYLTGASVIWQVREVTLTSAETTTGNARVILQRAGTTVVRNDVTGKRSRLEPGEAYFASAGDSYTTVPEGNSPSTVWIFEVSNSDQVGPGAFYLSPDVDGYGEATYDFEFTRYVVPSEELVEILGEGGPMLVMVLSGSVNVALTGDVASLGARDGLVVDRSTIVKASGGDAVVVALTIGPTVSDASAAPPQAQQAPAGDTSESDDDAGDEGEEAAPAAPAEPAQPSGDDGAYVTSIKVGAQEGIAVTMYADGELVFDGWLEPGEWTQFFTGSTFEVYTTSGANTMFQNTCSTEPFWMDTTPGDAHYYLEAGPSSCAPVG